MKHEKSEGAKERAKEYGKPAKKAAPKKAAAKKVAKVMHEFGAKQLHSGSKKGPLVTNPKQAVAIAMSEAGMKAKPKFKKK